MEAIATLGQRTARLYEVYWADLLEADAVRGTFNPLEFNSLAWFPWLNRKAGLYSESYGLQVFLWTVLLSPLALFGLVAGSVYAGLFTLAGKSFKAVLDRTLADVTNYATSVGQAAPQGALVGIADEILARFRAAHERAEAAGCGEIHVVAHSLGTVIAYHALTGYSHETVNVDATPPPMRVCSLYTIGSPLEKIRFIWPTLIRERPLAFKVAPSWPSLTWENFHDRLDFVSGKLRHRQSWGEVRNHGLLGRGGLVRAHVVYQGDPVFLRVVGERLFAAASQARLSLGRRSVLAAMSLGESAVFLLLFVAAPLAFAFGLTAIIGLLFAGYLAITSFFDAESAQFAAELGFAETFRIGLFVVALFLVGLLLLPIAIGRVLAASSHYAFRFRQTLEYVPSAEKEDENSLWSRSRALRILVRTALIGLVMAAGYVIGALFWQDETGDAPPWAPGQSTGHRIGLGIGLFFYSLLVDVLLACFTWLPVVGLWKGIKRYRRWAAETMRPPASLVQ